MIIGGKNKSAFHPGKTMQEEICVKMSSCCMNLLVIVV